jgi:hypothetical protein
MSDKYYIIRVEHVQKVCYVILGDVPVFKSIKIIDEIHSYFEKNNVDICTSLFFVSFDVYQKWLRLMVAEDLIEIDSSDNAVLDETQLSSLKSHATSIKYELEIELHASIRSYTGDIAENLFNEWFNGAQSDKQKKKGMPDNTVSPALSKIRIRIQDLERLKNNRSTVECDMITHQNMIDKLTYRLNEINEDIIHTQNRIAILRKEAIEEGYDEWFIDRSLKEMGYKGNI